MAASCGTPSGICWVWSWCLWEPCWPLSPGPLCSPSWSDPPRTPAHSPEHWNKNICMRTKNIFIWFTHPRLGPPLLQVSPAHLQNMGFNLSRNTKQIKQWSIVSRGRGWYKAKVGISSRPSGIRCSRIYRNSFILLVMGFFSKKTPTKADFRFWKHKGPPFGFEKIFFLKSPQIIFLSKPLDCICSHDSKMV